VDVRGTRTPIRTQQVRSLGFALDERDEPLRFLIRDRISSAA
jgi:hypothetical protein